MSDTLNTAANGMLLPDYADRELNIAVVAVTDSFLPRGFKVQPHTETTGEQLWQSCVDGQPIVFLRDKPLSIFGDLEVEYAFQAITQHFMFTPPVAHTNHRPAVCAPMVIGGLERFMEELVKRYGDDSRTRIWRKRLWTATIGRLAFNALLGSISQAHNDVPTFVQRTLETCDPDGATSVDDVRDGYVAMYAKAEMVHDMIVGLAAATTETVDSKAAAQGVTFH